MQQIKLRKIDLITFKELLINFILTTKNLNLRKKVIIISSYVITNFKFPPRYIKFNGMNYSFSSFFTLLNFLADNNLFKICIILPEKYFNNNCKYLKLNFSNKINFIPYEDIHSKFIITNTYFIFGSLNLTEKAFRRLEKGQEIVIVYSHNEEFEDIFEDIGLTLSPNLTKKLLDFIYQ